MSTCEDIIYIEWDIKWGRALSFEVYDVYRTQDTKLTQKKKKQKKSEKKTVDNPSPL